MKTSRIAVKIVLRLFFIILCLGLASYFFEFGAFSLYDIKAHDTYFRISHPWTLIYPGILVASFIALLIISIKTKYAKTDVNWLLVLNTVILLVYCITFYIKLYQILRPGH